MIKIENKTTKIVKTVDGKGEKVYWDFSDLISLVLKAPLPKGIGLTFHEMGLSSKIIEKLDAKTEVLEFTKDEMELIKKIINPFEWTINTPEIAELGKLINQ